MIDPKSLRIGNIVQTSLNYGDWEELIIEPKDIALAASNPNLFRPIPLSEEWLIRGGFDTTTGDAELNYWNKERDSSVDYERATGLFFLRLHERYRRKHIMYLHHLQNLIMDLSGEELVFK